MFYLKNTTKFNFHIASKKTLLLRNIIKFKNLNFF